MVALELEVLAKKLDRFGWERDRGCAAHDRIVTDWMDALQDYPLDEVQAACRAAITANPDKMPNEGHVRAQIVEARRKHVDRLPRPREPECRSPITEEERKRRAQVAGEILGRFAREAR